MLTIPSTPPAVHDSPEFLAWLEYTVDELALSAGELDDEALLTGIVALGIITALVKPGSNAPGVLAALAGRARAQAAQAAEAPGPGI